MGFLNLADLENNARITQDSEFANNSRIVRGFFKQKTSIFYNLEVSLILELYSKF